MVVQPIQSSMFSPTTRHPMWLPWKGMAGRRGQPALHAAERSQEGTRGQARYTAQAGQQAGKGWRGGSMGRWICALLATSSDGFGAAAPQLGRPFAASRREDHRPGGCRQVPDPVPYDYYHSGIDARDAVSRAGALTSAMWLANAVDIDMNRTDPHSGVRGWHEA